MEVAMQHETVKLCADSLRTYFKEKNNINVKAAHAHELVSAFVGYRSKNAMLADTKYPLESMKRAEIFVMMPDEFIDQRRNDLEGLSNELPDNYELGRPVYNKLISEERWNSEFPPFRSFPKLAKYFVERDPVYRETFQNYIALAVKMHHIVEVHEADGCVFIEVVHAHETTTPDEYLAVGMTMIKLRRIAGRIGYLFPELSTEIWTAGAKKLLKKKSS